MSCTEGILVMTETGLEAREKQGRCLLKAIISMQIPAKGISAYSLESFLFLTKQAPCGSARRSVPRSSYFT